MPDNEHDPLSATRRSLKRGGPWLAGVAFVLSGCADLSWHKEGASAAALENDLAECRGEARRNAGPDPRLVRPDAGRIVGMNSAFRPSASSGQLDGDRFLVEHDLTRICMQRRSYELVPADQRPPR
jgi:hypothetical protein